MNGSQFTGFSSSMTLAGAVKALLGLFDAVIPVLVALAIVYFFIGIIKYIRHAGKQSDRTTMLWSLVVLFVLFSFWGILRIMTNTFLTPSTSSGSSEYYHTIDDNAGI